MNCQPSEIKHTGKLRIENSFYIQLCGRLLILHKFDKSYSQNRDGSGYNIFEGLKQVESFTNPDELIKYLTDNNIKIPKQYAIIELPKLCIDESKTY